MLPLFLCSVADEDKQYSMYSTKPVDIMNAVKDNFIRYDTYGEDGSYHREDREGNRMVSEFVYTFTTLFYTFLC